MVFIPLGFLVDKILIPVIRVGAEGVKSHHTTGGVRGLSLLPASWEALLSRRAGNPGSMEYNLLEICQVYAKASYTLTEME